MLQQFTPKRGGRKLLLQNRHFTNNRVVSVNLFVSTTERRKAAGIPRTGNVVASTPRFADLLRRMSAPQG